MSDQYRHGVISSFLLCVAVLLFAAKASATEVPFEELLYGTSLDSRNETRGEVSSAASSGGSGSGNLIIQKTGHAVGVSAVLASFRSAARHSQPDLGVPVPSRPAGRQTSPGGSSGSGLPFFPFANSRSSSNGRDASTRGSSGSQSGHTGVGSAGLVIITAPADDTGTGTREWGDFDEAPDGRVWGDAGDAPGGRVWGDAGSAPVPEPSAALVFGLGALLVKSATRRTRR